MTSRRRERPWVHWQGLEKIPNVETLRLWRDLADKLAAKAGASWSCDLCKRPCKGKPGKVELWWGSKPVDRRICFACYMDLTTFVAQRETLGARSHLPVQEINEWEE